jgi:hypothetical protein
MPKRALMVTLTLAWPAIMVGHALLRPSRNRERGLGGALRKWWVCSSAGVEPYVYDFHEVYLSEKRRRAEAWLGRWQRWHLGNILSFGLDRPVLHDKALFGARAAEAGLPVARTLCSCDGGTATQHVSEDELHFDLVLKGAGGSGGKTVQLWRLVEPNRWEGEEGRRLTWNELVELACQLSLETGETWLFQRRLVNHDVIRAVAPNALSTCRIVTNIDADGSNPRVLLALFRLPSGDGLIDNYDSGGIAGPIDLATGRLGKAKTAQRDAQWQSHHPTTGVQFEGLALPCWEEAKALASLAHERIPESRSVGWDVVITPDGPLLLEANENWGVELAQRCHDTPILATEFADICLDCFERWRAGRPVVDDEPRRRCRQAAQAATTTAGAIAEGPEVTA